MSNHEPNEIDHEEMRKELRRTRRKARITLRENKTATTGVETKKRYTRKLKHKRLSNDY